MVGFKIAKRKVDIVIYHDISEVEMDEHYVHWISTTHKFSANSFRNYLRGKMKKNIFLSVGEYERLKYLDNVANGLIPK